MGLAVLVITVGPVVSLMLVVVLIHAVNVLLVCLSSDLLDLEWHIRLKDCWIERCKSGNGWFS